MFQRFLKRLFARRSVARRRGRALRSFPPHLEVLDTRILPSVTANLSAGILDIIADDGTNQVQLVPSAPGQVSVTESDTVVATFARSDVQVAVFQYGRGSSTFDNSTDIPVQPLRLFTRPRLTPDQLNQAGALDALVVGNTLTFAGPSGAAFQITGSWNATTDDAGDGQFVHTFTATGSLTLATPLGDLPFTVPDDQPLTVQTRANPLTAAFGAVDSVSWQADFLDTASADSPLRPLADRFGVAISTGLTTLDVRLGSDLADTGLPLNPALPYIEAVTPTYSAQFGDLVAQPGADNPLTVVFDPADPALYVQVQEFTVGASLHGYIPYTPTYDLPGLDTTPLYGNLYGQGTFVADDVAAGFTGAAVLNLDAQQGGQLLQNLQGAQVAALFAGQLSLADFAAADSADLLAGINGAAQVTYQGGGWDLPLSLLGASALYSPGSLSLAGEAAPAPFGGTPLAFVLPAGLATVSGTLDNQGGGSLQVTADSGALGSYAVSGLAVQLGADGVTLDAQLTPQAKLGAVALYGNAQPDGTYQLQGHVDTSLFGFATTGTATLTGSGLGLAGQVTVPQVGVIPMAGAVSPVGPAQLTGQADITIAGFAITGAHFILDPQDLRVSVHLNLPGAGQADLSGTISPAGTVSARGTATLIVAGFTLSDAFLQLSNSRLNVFATAVSLGSAGHVDLNGTIAASGAIDLGGTTILMVADFTLTSTQMRLQSTGMTATVITTVPNVGQVSLSGSVTATGQIDLTGSSGFQAAGFALANVQFLLTGSGLRVDADASVPVLGMGHFSGRLYQDGSFAISATATHGTVVDFPVTNVTATLSPARLDLGATATLPLVGTVVLAGQGYNDGTFSLTASASDSLHLNGFTLTGVTATLQQPGLTLAGNTTFPVLGAARLSGPVLANGHYNLTVTAAQAMAAGYALTGLVATLSDGSASLQGQLALPGLGSVVLQGPVQPDGSFTLTANLARTTWAGFPVTDTLWTLATSGLTVHGTAALAVVGTVTLAGPIDPNGHFAWTVMGLQGMATGFALVNASVTFSNTGVSLQGQGMIPLVGSVPLQGPLTPAGDYTLTGSAAHFPVGAFVLDNAALTLTRAQLSVAAAATLPNLGTVPFTGSIEPNGGYMLTGTAGLSVAGFALTNAALKLTPAGDHLDVNVTAPISGLGTVAWAGSYTPGNGGRFNLSASIAGPVTSSGVVLSNLSATLTNDGLTVQTCTALGTLANVCFAGSLTPAGMFNLVGQLDTFPIAGFALTTGVFMISSANPVVAITAQVTVPAAGPEPVPMTGFYRASDHHFQLTGAATLAVAGYSLPQATTVLTLTESGMAVSGRTTVPGPGSLAFVGTVTPVGHYDLTGQAVPSWTVAGFPLLNPQLNLSEARLAVQASVDVPVLGRTAFSGTISAAGQFDVGASAATLTLAGFSLSSVALRLSNSDLKVTGTVQVPALGSTSFTGSVTPAGVYTLAGSAGTRTFAFDGWVVSDAAYTLGNTSMAVQGQVTLPLAGTLVMKGLVTPAGQYTLDGSAQFRLASFPVNLNYHLGNSGLGDVDGQVNLPVAGWTNVRGSLTRPDQYRLTSTQTFTLPVGGFSVMNTTATLTNNGLTLDGQVSVYLAGTVRFLGSATPAGSFSLTGATTTTITLSGFTVTDLNYTLTNDGMTVVSHINLPAAGTVYRGSLLPAPGNVYALVSTLPVVSIAGYNLTGASYTLTSNGMTVAGRMTVPLVGDADVSGPMTPAAQYQLHGPGPGFMVAGFAVRNVNLTLTNAGLAYQAQVSIPQVGWVDIRSSPLASGQIRLPTPPITIPIGGWTMTGAVATLTNSTMEVEGDVNVPAFGRLHFKGSTPPNGQYNVSVAGLTGHVAGFDITNTALTLTVSVMSVTGTVHVSGAGSLTFSGTVRPAGDYNMTATLPSMDVQGFTVTSSRFTLTTTGMSVDGRVNVPLAGVLGFSGSAAPGDRFVDGSAYRLTSSAVVFPAGFRLGASYLLGRHGLEVTGPVTIPLVSPLTMSGSVTTGGAYTLSYTGNLAVLSYVGTGNLTLTSSALQVNFNPALTIVTARPHLSGTIGSSGAIHLTGSIGLNLNGLQSGTIGFTFDNGGLRAQVTGAADVSAVVGSGFWSTGVGAHVFVDVTFAVPASGVYSASGTFRAVGTQGASGTWNVDFTLSTSQLRIRTSAITVNVWGFNFHPFGDVTINY